MIKRPFVFSSRPNDAWWFRWAIFVIIYSKDLYKYQLTFHYLCLFCIFSASLILFQLTMNQQCILFKYGYSHGDLCNLEKNIHYFSPSWIIFHFVWNFFLHVINIYRWKWIERNGYEIFSWRAVTVVNNVPWRTIQPCVCIIIWFQFMSNFRKKYLLIFSRKIRVHFFVLLPLNKTQNIHKSSNNCYGAMFVKKRLTMRLVWSTDNNYFP